MHDSIQSSALTRRLQKDPVSDENRRFARMSADRIGTLWHTDGALLGRVRMLEMSVAGACLDVGGNLTLPLQFSGSLGRQTGAGAPRVRCELVWQNESLAGIRFCTGQDRAS